MTFDFVAALARYGHVWSWCLFRMAEFSGIGVCLLTAKETATPTA